VPRALPATVEPGSARIGHQYYRDARRQRIERRRDLAKRLGITLNALSIRVSRIRTALEASVESCREEGRLIRPDITLERAISM
jgi:hypothetical protein